MGRSPCCEDNNGLKKGPWTTEEDEKLVQYIQNHGLGSWRALPKLAGLNRCGKSCRLRWTNYLRPDIKRGKFSQEEEQTILHLHSIIGNKWSTIASHLPGRTDNEIKNYWNTHLRKRLIQMGFDPMTHQPRTDLFASLSNLIALANLSDLFQNLVDKQFLHNHNLIPQQQHQQQQQQQDANDVVIANLINSVLDTSCLKQSPEVSSTSHVVVENNHDNNNFPEYNNNNNNNNNCDYSQPLHHQIDLIMQSHHQNDDTRVNIIDTNNTTEQHQVTFSSQPYSLNNNISTSDIDHHHRRQQDYSYACQRVGHGGDSAWFDDYQHLPIASSELSPSDHLPDMIELSDQYETSFIEANVYGSAASTTCNSWPQTSL